MAATRVYVAGAGYVGLTATACLAHLGHEVVCYDRDRERIAQLTAGRVPIREPGLGDLLCGCGPRPAFTAAPPAGTVAADVVLICVGTPAQPDGSCDLSALHALVGELAPRLRPGQLLLTRSTVPPGTNRRLAADFRRAGADVRVVACPEFLREGSAVADFLRPHRIVLGAEPRADAVAAAALFALLPGERVLTSWEGAELIKYAANAFLAVRVSFANELAATAGAYGADIREVIRGVGLDPRIGTAYLSPGPGFGGSCLPKDVSALLHAASARGRDLRVVRAAAQVNEGQAERLVGRLATACGALTGRLVTVWGLAFKAGTDDLRASPALRLIDALRAAGAAVRAHDPAAMGPAASLDTPPVLVPDPLEAARDAHAVVIATGWPEYGRVDLKRLRSVMAGPWLLDCHGLIDRRSAEQAGLRRLGVGD